MALGHLVLPGLYDARGRGVKHSQDACAGQRLNHPAVVRDECGAKVELEDYGRLEPTK